MSDILDDLKRCLAEWSKKAADPHTLAEASVQIAILRDRLAARDAALARGGHTEAGGYAASLRQQARWVREAVDKSVPLHQRIDLGDVDTDELDAAAGLIERQDAEITALRSEHAAALSRARFEEREKWAWYFERIASAPLIEDQQVVYRYVAERLRSGYDPTPPRDAGEDG